MRSGALVLLSLVAWSCGARTPERAPSLPSPPKLAAKPRREPETPPPAPAAKPWAKVYERECHGSITLPIISPSGARFVFCDAAFDAKNGTFQHSARLGVLALFDDGRALRNDYSDHGLSLGPAARDAEGDADGDERHTTGGFPERIALSRDGRRVASLERVATGGALFVRELPSLAELTRVPLERVNDRDSVGFVDDGDPVVVVDRDCRTTSCGKDCKKTECATRGAYRARATGLEALPAAFDASVSMSVSASGERAVLELASGARRVVKLPNGELVARLPDAPSGDDESPLALDARGERVAWVDSGLHIARLEHGSVREIHRDPALSACELTFGPDGALYASCHSKLSVLREGAEARPAPAARYPDPPAGFRSPLVRGNELTFDRFEDSSEIVHPNQVARFRSDDDDIDVWVFAGDALELGPPGELDAWERLALARFATDAGKVERIDGWSELGNRSLEFAVFVRDGCDPVDRYVRLSEKGGVLYRVVVELPPGTPKRKALPRLRSFFDVLGAHPGARRLAQAPPPPRSPC